MYSIIRFAFASLAALWADPARFLCDLDHAMQE